MRRLSEDSTAKFAHSFSEHNLEQMRFFPSGWQIPQTVSAE
jgi:hypothetical protein